MHKGLPIRKKSEISVKETTINNGLAKLAEAEKDIAKKSQEMQVQVVEDINHDHILNILFFLDLLNCSDILKMIQEKNFHIFYLIYALILYNSMFYILDNIILFDFHYKLFDNVNNKYNFYIISFYFYIYVILWNIYDNE